MIFKDILHLSLGQLDHIWLTLYRQLFPSRESYGKRLTAVVKRAREMGFTSIGISQLFDESIMAAKKQAKDYRLLTNEWDKAQALMRLVRRFIPDFQIQDYLQLVFVDGRPKSQDEFRRDAEAFAHKSLGNTKAFDCMACMGKGHDFPSCPNKHVQGCPICGTTQHKFLECPEWPTRREAQFRDSRPIEADVPRYSDKGVSGDQLTAVVNPLSDLGNDLLEVVERVSQLQATAEAPGPAREGEEEMEVDDDQSFPPPPNFINLVGEDRTDPLGNTQERSPSPEKFVPRNFKNAAGQTVAKLGAISVIASKRDTLITKDWKMLQACEEKWRELVHLTSGKKLALMSISGHPVSVVEASAIVIDEKGKCFTFHDYGSAVESPAPNSGSSAATAGEHGIPAVFRLTLGSENSIVLSRLRHFLHWHGVTDVLVHGFTDLTFFEVLKWNLTLHVFRMPQKLLYSSVSALRTAATGHGIYMNSEFYHSSDKQEHGCTPLAHLMIDRDGLGGARCSFNDCVAMILVLKDVQQTNPLAPAELETRLPVNLVRVKVKREKFQAETDSWSSTSFRDVIFKDYQPHSAKWARVQRQMLPLERLNWRTDVPRPPAMTNDAMVRYNKLAAQWLGLEWAKHPWSTDERWHMFAIDQEAAEHRISEEFPDPQEIDGERENKPE